MDDESVGRNAATARPKKRTASRSEKNETAAKAAKPARKATASSRAKAEDAPARKTRAKATSGDEPARPASPKKPRVKARPEAAEPERRVRKRATEGEATAEPSRRAPAADAGFDAPPSRRDSPTARRAVDAGFDAPSPRRDSPATRRAADAELDAPPSRRESPATRRAADAELDAPPSRRESPAARRAADAGFDAPPPRRDAAPEPARSVVDRGYPRDEGRERRTFDSPRPQHRDDLPPMPRAADPPLKRDELDRGGRFERRFDRRDDRPRHEGRAGGWDRPHGSDRERFRDERGPEGVRRESGGPQPGQAQGSRGPSSEGGFDGGGRKRRRRRRRGRGGGQQGDLPLQGQGSQPRPEAAPRPAAPMDWGGSEAPRDAAPERGGERFDRAGDRPDRDGRGDDRHFGGGDESRGRRRRKRRRREESQPSPDQVARAQQRWPVERLGQGQPRDDRGQAGRHDRNEGRGGRRRRRGRGGRDFDDARPQHGGGSGGRRFDERSGAQPANLLPERDPFTELVSVDPDEKIELELERDELSMRVVDIITPIGKGQRGLIVAPPKTGKTTLLMQLAKSITENHPEVELMVVLIDERPEEVTAFRRAGYGTVWASSNDESVKRHVQLTAEVLARAKDMVLEGKDVCILLDSITRMARAHNNWTHGSSRTLSGGLDSRAMERPKRFFGAARNILNGGSLTVLATALIDTGSRMDEVIFQEFKGTGNMELQLDRRVAERRIWPAIDIQRSGTRKEEKLFPKDEYEGVVALRRALSGKPPSEAMDMLLSRLKQYPMNRQFLLDCAKKAQMALL